MKTGLSHLAFYLGFFGPCIAISCLAMIGLRKPNVSKRDAVLKGLLWGFGIGVVLLATEKFYVSPKASPSSQVAETGNSSSYDDIIENDLKKLETENLKYARSVHGAVIGIRIEGVITPGTSEAFEKIVKYHQGGLRDVYLQSPGGSTMEAIRIGKLVRALKMSTHAPMGGRDRPICLGTGDLKTAKMCTCQSACFLVFVAGVQKSGDIVGLHRAYLPHELLKDLSADQALKAASDAKRITREYLQEMEVPTQFIERALATSSSEMDFLSKEDVQKYFSEFTPDYAEWITAKCGDPEKLQADERSALANSPYSKQEGITVRKLRELDPKFRAADDAVEGLLDCRREVSEKMSIDAFKQIFPN